MAFTENFVTWTSRGDAEANQFVNLETTERIHDVERTMTVTKPVISPASYMRPLMEFLRTWGGQTDVPLEPIFLRSPLNDELTHDALCVVAAAFSCWFTTRTIYNIQGFPRNALRDVTKKLRLVETFAKSSVGKGKSFVIDDVLTAIPEDEAFLRWAVRFLMSVGLVYV